MTHYEKPRLFRKTIRASGSATPPALQLQKTSNPCQPSLTSPSPLSSFVFCHKVKRKVKKEGEQSTTAVKTGYKLKQRNDGKASAGKLKLGRSDYPTPLREGGNLSFTLNQSVSSSLLHSHDNSPRPVASLNIEAINLELELTSLLCQSEGLPSPQRRAENFQAHMRVLHTLGERDPVYGEVLKLVAGEVGRTLLATRAKEVHDLTDQNQSLKKYLSDQKDSLRKESQERLVHERVSETLIKEKHLLCKKVEQLQLQCRRAAATRTVDEVETTRKIEELEEALKAARKREGRLLSLLEVVKNRVKEQSPGEREMVPPLDLLLMKPHGVSRPPSKTHFPSATSTEALKSSFSLDLL